MDRSPNNKIELRGRLFAVAALTLLMCTSVLAWADGTETLGVPTIPIASGTGVVAAGTGMVTQPGAIDIDIPAGAAVAQVLLPLVQSYLG